MKFYFSAIFLLMMTVSGYSQKVFVPYRVGDKFGIADEQGSLVLQPAYDILETFYDAPQLMTGFKIKDNVALSSLIYKNKVILQDQPYNAYYDHNDLIIAVQYFVKGSRVPALNSDVNVRYFLFNLFGKQLLEGDHDHINVYDDLDREKVMNEVLIGAYDMQERFSLFIYDRKLKKISKTIISSTRYVESDDSEQYPHNRLKFDYLDASGNGQRIVLQPEGKSFKVVSKTAVEIQPDRRERFDDGGPAVPGMEEPPMPFTASADTILLKMPSIEIRRSFYYLLKAPEEIKYDVRELDRSYNYIVVKNGKMGLMDARKGTFIVPLAYDTISVGEFPGHNGGYVLKNDSTYGLYIYRHPENILIEPVFKMLPLVRQINYSREGFHLIKLYDSNGRFFCYADQTGRMFYRDR
jgi:hypothetical protein